MRSSLLLLALLGLALVLLLARTGPARPARADATPVPGSAGTGSPSGDLALAPPSGGTEARSAPEPAEERSPPAVEGPAPGRERRVGTWSLVARVSAPTEGSEPLWGRLDLLDAAGPKAPGGMRAAGNGLGAWSPERRELRAEGLRADACRLAGRFFGFLPVDVHVERPPDGDRRELEVVLVPARLVDVRVVRPDGTSLAWRLPFTIDLAVELDPFAGEAPASDPPGPFLPLSGDRGGRIGRLEVRIPLPAEARLVHRERTLATTVLAPGDDELLFVLDEATLASLAARLTCRVVSRATGEAVSSGLFWLVGARGTFSTSFQEGRIEVGDLTPGTSRLLIHAEGHAPWEGQVVLVAGAATDLAVIELDEPRVLAVTVLLPDGTPARGASVTCLPPSLFGSPTLFTNGRFGEARTGAEGVARIGVPREPCLLEARHVVAGTTYASPVEELDPRRDPSWTLRLRETATVHLGIGLGRDPGELRVRDDGGHVVQHADVSAGSARTFRLPVGSYRIELVAAGSGETLLERPLVLREGEGELTLEL